MSSVRSEVAPPRITRLGTTPIKGFAMQESPSLLLTASGVLGDRAFFLVDGAGRLLSATRTACFLRYRARFDLERDRLTIGRAGDTVLSDLVTVGEPVRAHFFGDRYATGHVVEGRWGSVLTEIAGRPVRLVRAAGPLGGYDVHPVSLVSESSVQALDPAADAPVDPRRFRMTLTIDGVAPFAEDTWAGHEIHVGGTTASAAGRGLHLGVYAEVVRPGRVRVGDEVWRCGSGRRPAGMEPCASSS